MKWIPVSMFVWISIVPAVYAQCPDPGQSSVEPWDTNGKALVIPGATHNADNVTVTVLNSLGMPCVNSAVTIEFVDCVNLCVDSPDGLTGMTNAGGVVILNPRVGGCETCTIRVWAGPVLLRTYTQVISPDWDGVWADGTVGPEDELYFNAHYPSPPKPYVACVDYDCNGLVDLADKAIFGDVFGESNAVTCPYPVDPAQSSVEPWDTYGQAFVIPGDASPVDEVTVTALNHLGYPCAGRAVTIEFVDCVNLCIDSPDGLNGTTDATGVAILNPRVGGCETCTINVWAGSELIRTYTQVTSPDWNGAVADGRVSVDDERYFTANSPSPPRPYVTCVDYNGDGIVDLLDAAIFGGAEGEANRITCPFQGDVRIFHTEIDQCLPQTTANIDSIILGEWDFTGGGGGCSPMGWTPVDNTGRGNFAGLFPGSIVLQLENCLPYPNLTCLWGFFNGSTWDYSCGGYPGVPVVPYGAGSPVLYLDNEIWSPNILLLGSGTSVLLLFDVYRDLELDPLVFYKWRVRSVVDNEYTEWRDKDWFFYGLGQTKDWIRHIEEIGELIEPGATHIQIALGAVDMCDQWCGVLGNGTCHSNAPLIDNVKVCRLQGFSGPMWNVRQIDLFQDNFATDGTITGTVRADMAKDIMPRGNPTILPGDSICVWVDDFQNGLAIDPSGFGPAAYCYVTVIPPQASKSGPNLEAPETRPFIGKRFPYVGTVVDGNGVSWFKYRMDTVFVDPGFTAPVPDRFCFDLKDDILTPPDKVCFFFGADNTAASTTYWTEFAYTTADFAEVTECPMEFTCLPSTGYELGGDILYVDAFDGRGAQIYFDQAFQQLGIEELVDRYDQRGPSSLVNNGLGSRVTNVSSQIIDCYRKIIWNSGDLPVGTIGDGLMWPLKTDDFSLIYTFLDQSLRIPGVYFSGDNLAEEWSTLGGSATATRATYMNFALASSNHAAFGEPISPLLEGVGTVFVHGGTPDEIVAFGGCPMINNFDVFDPVDLGLPEMANPSSGVVYVLSQTTPNTVGSTARVVLSGFSFHYVNWASPMPTPVKAHHLQDILLFLENDISDPDGIGNTTRPVDFLANNKPNPFNPVTTIRYGIKEPTHVSLKVYNVAGQLVKTLVDEHQSPSSAGFAVTWEGDDDAGRQVASGVYFYRLVTDGFTQTKKMVLLK